MEGVNVAKNPCEDRCADGQVRANGQPENYGEPVIPRVCAGRIGALVFTGLYP